MSTLPPNMTKVAPGLYIVRTQAGFRKAIKDELGPEWVKGVRNFPKSYPSLVSLSLGYCGYHYVEVSHVRLDKLKEVLKDAD